MASAAAVAADAARSPLRIDIDNEHGIASTITAKDDEHTGLTSDEDEDDINIPTRNHRPQQMEEQVEEEDDVDADLFGEDVNDGRSRRTLNDEELDSGDDEGRRDREGTQEQEGEEMTEQERSIQDVELPRMPAPVPSDGEMYLLKVPKFLAIDAKCFTPDTFIPPTADHHSQVASKNFSAHHTASTTIRWRRSPSNQSELQSNARINRWSDGSLTLQFASDPTVQYDINGNALAPPQRNPAIPTPTSVKVKGDKTGRQGIDNGTFDAGKHAFTYLVLPMPTKGLIKVTNVLTTGLTVSPPADFIDEAIANLQQDLAAASGMNTVGSSVALTNSYEDPELAKKRAEQAEREKARARRKQEAQVERERERSNRTLGRHGLASQRYGGLSAGMLEDDEGMTTTRGRPATKPRAPRRRRANSEYSSEEDYGRRGFKVSKEDDYDVEDDFVAASDEEEEEPEDDEDDDDNIIEEGRQRRDATPKRARNDEEADAEGEDDGTPAGGVERKRRRMVVDDDDE